VLEDARVVAFVGSQDLRASERFYRGMLGLRMIESSDFACVYDARGTMLRVTRVDLAARAPYTVLGWTVEDIGAAVERLRARGVSFKRYSGLEQDRSAIWRAPGGTRVAWFEDPDANTLSLTQLPPA
jgi:catechol 2,3-dioxygenase-like lactoylglutathione lyase family enzyme